jgi:hypothetical protein
MWCSVCQSDVATEVGADNRRVSCSNCGHLLGGAAGAMHEQTSAAVPPPSRAEEARQLLDRWAKGHFFDPYGPPKKTGIAADTPVAAAVQIEGHVETSPDDPAPTSIPATSPATANAADDARNVETIDERSFIVDSPKPELQSEQPKIEPSAEQSNVESYSAIPVEDSATEKVLAVANEPEAVAAAADLTESTSSAELDRLTREIMARVSKITEAREASNAPSSGDGEIVAAGLAASFPEPDLDARRSEPAAGHNRPSNTAATAFDEPIQMRPEMSHRIDATHQPVRTSEPPPMAVSTNRPPAEASPGGWYNNIGQMLAYLGIIFLTAGTCGVIVSYFGGPANYAPYGWLGATIGQMLLFLGIVTLISAGMEQTSQELRQAVDQRMDEVTQRLDQIGTRIMRIEEADSDSPPKPHMLSHAEQARSRTSRHAPTSIRDDG